MGLLRGMNCHGLKYGIGIREELCGLIAEQGEGQQASIQEDLPAVSCRQSVPALAF